MTTNLWFNYPKERESERSISVRSTLILSPLSGNSITHGLLKDIRDDGSQSTVT